MKKSFSSSRSSLQIVLLTSAFTVSLSLACLAQEPIPIANAGFEDGAQGWTPSKADADAKLSLISPEAAHTGKSGLRVKQAVGDNSWMQSSRIPVEAGKNYRLSFWARAVEESGIAVFINFFSESGQSLPTAKPLLVQIPPTAKEWKEYHLDLVTPEGAGGLRAAVHAFSNSAALADFDDFSLVPTGLNAAAPATNAAAKVAPWKDNKKSAFLVELDDSIPSDIQNALPELQKRGLTATFYINPNTAHYIKAKEQWETTLPKLPGVVYGNHTMTHQGLTDFAMADADLAQVNAIILKAFPGKEPRLISFAKPGVGKDKWTITDDDYQKVLKKNNLVAREGAGLAAAQFNNLKTAEGMLQIVDDAIAKGRVRSILFHGVGGDWLVTPTDVFTAFLDGLVARKDSVWITDHISAYKYETEFKTSKVNVLETTSKQIRLELKSDADPQLYDFPLTIIAQVPADWKKVEILQGATKTSAAPSNGQIQFEALPNSEPISMRPAA